MAKYSYIALQDKTKTVSGEIEASSPREAREKIRQLGYLPTKVYIETAEEEKTSVQYNSSKITHLSINEKIAFTSELNVLLSSGIPVIEALQCVKNNTSSHKITQICTDLTHLISSGYTFSQSLTQAYEKAFGFVYTSLVKTGEEAGELEETLERLLVILKKQERIKNKIKQASIYPAVLVAMMAGLFILFTKVIFPKFVGIIMNFGGDIPPVAQALIGTCNFINNYWWLILITIGAGCYAVKLLIENQNFKKKWDSFMLQIPALRDFIQYINLANFMTVLQISYDAGVPIIAGLELSAKTIGNNIIKNKVNRATSYVRNGKSLAESLQKTNAVPQTFISMISAGEKSGTLGRMLHDAAQTIDDKVDMTLEALTRLFEPAIILIMGGFVLFILLGFYQLYIGMLGSLL